MQSSPGGFVAGRRKLVNIFDDRGHVLPLDTILDIVLRRAIEEHDGSFISLARTLKVGRSTLYRYVDELNEGDKATNVSCRRVIVKKRLK
jgi:transcriptional regulator of acetoin/glycerol metabolism